MSDYLKDIDTTLPVKARLCLVKRGEEFDDNHAFTIFAPSVEVLQDICIKYADKFEKLGDLLVEVTDNRQN